jgi:hypothetical protein
MITSNTMNNKLAIVDCGKNTSTLFYNGKIHTYSHDELLDKITDLPKGVKVVSEEAHLGTARKGLSKSQPFNGEQLLQFYENCENKGIILRFFPQDSTFRAQQYYRTKHNLSEDEFPKSDYNDPKAIYQLLIDKMEISLSHPKKTFAENSVREEGYLFKQDLNAHLNYARASEPKPYAFKDDGCKNFIIEHIEEIVSQLSPQSKVAFALTDDSRYKKTGKINLNKIKPSQFYSIVATLIDYNGKPRTRESTGALPGWKFIKRYVICMTPFQRRCCVCRSNLYHHGLKNYLKKQIKLNGLKEFPKGTRGVFSQNQDDFFVKCRIEYCNCIREVFQICRKILNNK